MSACRRADPLRRGHARPGVAREEAPGAAGALQRCVDGARDRGHDLEARRRAGARGVGRPGARVVGRSAACGWLKKGAPELEPPVRAAPRRAQALAQARRRRRRWAELLTDPVALAEGFAGSDVSPRRSTARAVDAAQLASRSRAGRRGGQADPRPRGPRAARRGRPAGRLDDEDDALLLRLHQLKRGGLKVPTATRSYEHIAIDEAQDRCALEVKVLFEAVTRRSPSALTIAGDTAQRLVFDNGFSGWAELLADSGPAAAAAGAPAAPVLPLDRRGHALARGMLGPGSRPRSRSPPATAPVELHEFSDLGEAVAFLGDALRTLIAREPTAAAA